MRAPHRRRLRGLVAALLVLVALPAPAAAQDRADVLVVGDSLAVGMRPHLERLLPGRSLAWDVRNGRTTPEGLRALRELLREHRPTAVVVSLGTNDGPDPRRFADRLSRALAAIPPEACVVWHAISRPPRKGPFLGLNRVLRRRAADDTRLTLVHWDREVARGRVALPDGLHPDEAGYARRSRLAAAAVRRGCDIVAPA